MQSVTEMDPQPMFSQWETADFGMIAVVPCLLSTQMQLLLGVGN